MKNIDGSVKLKDFKNKKIIRRLAFNLEEDFNRIEGLHGVVNFSGGFDEGYYRIYANPYKSNFEFNFKCKYLNDEDVLNEDDIFSELTDLELESKANKLKDMTYITIDYVGVNPTGQGIGTQLVKTFLNRIDEFDKFKRIYLIASGSKTRNFWKKFGFKEIKYPIKIHDGILGENMFLDLK